jgi:hypothetical protein
MKVRFCCAVLLLFVFSGICFAQVPVPSLPKPATEFSLVVIVADKDSTLTHWGEGEQLTFTHFVYKNLGVQAEGDFVRINFDGVREGAGRVGPVVRFINHGRIQPYAHFLGGITDTKADYLKPVGQYNTAGSLLMGGGFDFPISHGGEWYATAGADIEYDWTAVHTKVGRVVMGFSYRFGHNGVYY